MHFKIDDKGIVTYIHTERWDRLALGPDLEERIEKYTGEDYRDLIYFILCEKLFLKLQILYSMSTGDRETICYWFTAPIYNDDENDIKKNLNIMTGFDSLINQTKFADIHLESNDVSLIVTLKEMRLARLLNEYGCTSKLVRILTDIKTSKDIAFSFNIARNAENAIFFAGDNIQDLGPDKVMPGILPYPMFAARSNQTGEIQILSEADIEKMSDEQILEKYSSIFPTTPHDEGCQNRIDIVKKRLKRIARNSPQVNSKKPLSQKVSNWLRHNIPIYSKIKK